MMEDSMRGPVMEYELVEGFAVVASVWPALPVHCRRGLLATFLSGDGQCFPGGVGLTMLLRALSSLYFTDGRGSLDKKVSVQFHRSIRDYG